MTEGALVLEGGSLRSMFTAGVLDVFIEEGIELSYVNGVSAGSMAGMNYITKQKGRMIRINKEYLHDRRYMGMRNLLKDRSIFNFKFVFGELSGRLIPFDYEAFYRSPQRFEVAATRCRNGKTEYFTKGEAPDMMAAVQASCSMPLLCSMADVNHRKYLDGGLSMPIAYQRAFDLGYEKVVLILTREQGFRKKPYNHLKQKAYNRYFEPLPELLKTINDVPKRYNRMQEEIDRLEQEGKVFVIRPPRPVTVSRLEQDVRKLEALYQQGMSAAKQQLTELKSYLKIET